MRAKLFVELEVEVKSRLAIMSIQLNSSLAATVVHLLQARKLANRWPVMVGGRGWLFYSTLIRD
jgi:hypothetical protein